MSSGELELSSKELEYYTLLFVSLNKTEDGLVSRREAMRLFVWSGLIDTELSRIWNIADMGNYVYFNFKSFCRALKLIACSQQNITPKEGVLETLTSFPLFFGIDLSFILLRGVHYLSPITNDEREKYLKVFRSLGPANEAIDGFTGKTFFEESRLPLDKLSKVWDLADFRSKGELNESEFIIAMHFINELKNGRLSNLPDKLPLGVLLEAHERDTLISFDEKPREFGVTSATPMQESVKQWKISDWEKQQSYEEFDKIDFFKLGMIQGAEAAAYLLNKSGLPVGDLAQIWHLSDSQNRGALSREEFTVAMFLVAKRKNGIQIPNRLPSSLQFFIDPSNSTKCQRDDTSPLEQCLGKVSQQKRNDDDNPSILDQISSLSIQTSNIQNKKISTKYEMESVISERKILESQFNSTHKTYEDALEDLREIQETIKQETYKRDKVRNAYKTSLDNYSNIQETIIQKKSELGGLRAEYETAQREMQYLEKEIVSIQEGLNNEKVKTEDLRRNIHDVQRRTELTRAELTELHSEQEVQKMNHLNRGQHQHKQNGSNTNNPFAEVTIENSNDNRHNVGRGDNETKHINTIIAELTLLKHSQVTEDAKKQVDTLIVDLEQLSKSQHQPITIAKKKKPLKFFYIENNSLHQ